VGYGFLSRKNRLELDMGFVTVNRLVSTTGGLLVTSRHITGGAGLTQVAE